MSVEAIPLSVSFRETFRFGTTDRSTSPNVVVIVRAARWWRAPGSAPSVPDPNGTGPAWST